MNDEPKIVPMRWSDLRETNFPKIVGQKWQSTTDKEYKLTAQQQRTKIQLSGIQVNLTIQVNLLSIAGGIDVEETGAKTLHIKHV